MITPTKVLFEWREPSIVAQKLIQDFGEAGFIWLDGDGRETGEWVILAADPIEQMSAREMPHHPTGSNPFQILRNLKPGHWTGWLSYEAGAWIEPKNPWQIDSLAMLWIARHDPVFKFNLKEKKLWLEGSDMQRLNLFSKWINSIDINQCSSDSEEKSDSKRGIPINTWKWVTESKQFSKKVEAIKKLIIEGDIFQANLSACCIGEKPKELLAIDLFLRLRQECPAPFSGIVIGDTDAVGEAIISTSPERFLKVMPSGNIETRPIKGTRPRDKDPIKDSELAVELISSPKDRAENIMIVDLLRNDLGKVCRPNTINVNQLVALESYPKVHHLTSVITGQLQTNKNWVDLLEASWPGGSISGAPKLRACQRLSELEPIARGPYCGSFLHIDWDGKFDSNILIRSLIVKENKVRVHAGCGIVADSDPINEAEELKWKLIPLLKALE